MSQDGSWKVHSVAYIEDAGVIRDGGPHYQPRPHGMRHSAVVHRLVSWYRTEVDDLRAMLWEGMMADTNLLGPWIRRFLLEHLVGERGLSINIQRRRVASESSLSK